MPDKVSTRIGAIVIGGSAKTAIFTPRKRRNNVGDIVKATPDIRAIASPIRKPTPEA
jgi:hypothetical protein